MEREKRTRQSNREYQERLRRERNQKMEQNSMEHFRVIPKSQASSYESSKVRTDNHVQKKRDSAKRREANRPSQRQGKSGNTNYTARRRPEQQETRQKLRKGQRLQESKKQQKLQTKTAVKRGNGRTSKERSGLDGKKQTAAVKSTLYYEYTLVFIVLFLIMFGLLMLYTASMHKGDYFSKQCLNLAVGIVAMFVTSKLIDYHWYEDTRVLGVLFIGAVISVCLVKSPIGVTLNGASRWIDVGPVTIQPAEIFKVAVILLNAALLSRVGRKISDYRVLVLFFAMAVLECLFIYKVTQNLSSAIIVAMITILMLFVAYPGYLLFFALGAIVVGVAALYIYGVLNGGGSGGFRSERIVAWLTPELADPAKVFQTNQGLYAIGSGGLFGKGLGSGTQKLILPEAMNDMIFAIICEELGMVGAFLVLVMFAILLYRLMFIAKNSKDLFGGMIVTGIFAHFMLQVILNIGVVTRLLPSTGVTLPFISYGGSALVFLLAEIGIALNVGRQIDFEEPKLLRKKVKKQ